jgi:pSer/pThr/pTyr-binding forkhead associated (FHA) protein
MSTNTDMRGQASTPALPAGAVVARLSARVGGSSVTCATDRPVTLIGSRRDCHLPVAHPDVSKLHCAIVHTGRWLLVCDLQSRTGTQLDDQPVRVAALRPGTTLRVGPVEIAVAWPDGATPPADDELAADLRIDPPIELSYQGRRFTISTSASVIGQRNTCDVSLDHPDVSLVHALLFALGGRPAICDLGSRSGTGVNGARRALAWLADGDHLQIATEEFTVGWVGRAPAAAPTPAAAPPPATAPDEPVPAAVGDIAHVLDGLHAHVHAARQALIASGRELEARDRALSEREAELEQRLAEIAQQGATLESERATLAARLDESNRALAAVEERQAALAAREANLARQAAELENRTRQLAAREAAEAQAARQMEQFKSALQQARAAFALIATPEAAGAETPGDTAPSASSERDLPPAPLVDRPLFGAAQPAAGLRAARPRVGERPRAPRGPAN